MALPSIGSGGFSRDLRYASRVLRANPLFTGVVVLTLALGIGANTAIFSVMNAVVLRALPVPEPDRLVNLHTSGWPEGSSQTGRGDASFPMLAFQHMRDGHTVLSGLAAYVPLAIGKTAVCVGTEPEEVEANMVSGDFFTSLGVPILCGRTLTSADETGRAPVAVLGYGYSNRRFGGNCSAVGQTIHVRGVPFTIVGVAARGFAGVDSARGTDVWIPMQERADLNAWGRQEGTPYSQRNWWFLMMVGRLAPGVTEQQALGRLNPVFQRAAFETVGRGPKEGEKPPILSFSALRGLPGLRDAYQEPLRILLAMVGLVLLIACGNVAVLLAARNAMRVREFSIRMAMGGGRLQLFRQLLTESLVLVAAGAALAWLFAMAATQALSTWSGLEIHIEPDRSVLLFTLAIGLAVALIFGLVPLRSAARVPVGLALKTSSATAHTDRQRSWGRKTIIALQVSLCVVLVIGAGLLVRTLRNLEMVNLGIRASGLLVFGISPQQGARTDADRIRFYDSLLTRIRALPGVESVTLMSNRIGSGWSNNTGAVIDGKRANFNGSASMRWNAVGAGYLTTLGTPLLQGRDFRDSDSASAPKVAIVNETFAKRYLANQDPLGHLVAMSTRSNAPQYTIVGVAVDSKYTGVREGTTAMAYFPYSQTGAVGTMHVEVRTPGSAEALLPVVQRAVREFAPDLPLLKPMTQQGQFAESFTRERLFARLAMCFGLLAIVLVSVGIYGTLAYMVNRRMSEIGIRMALGARRGQVLMMVLRESGVVFLAGVLVGTPLAIAATRLLRSMLFGVESSDPLTFAAGLTLIAVLVLIASWLPARRAASTDPMVALRNE